MTEWKRRRNVWRTPTSRAEKIAKSRATYRRIWDNGEGFIYVAKIPNEPLVKIGFSINPERRVLQAGAPRYTSKLTLLAKVPAAIWEEQALHRTLREHVLAYEIYPISILSHPAIPAELQVPA